MNEILDAIKAANTSVVAALAFEHPQYIDGTLYVTREQFKAIQEWASEIPLDPTNTRPAPVMDIPVVILHPGESVRASDGGRMLICSSVDKALYTLNLNALEETGKNLQRALIEG